MNYGFYLSASGALTSMHRMETISNNIANASTVGFKPTFAVMEQRLPERLERGGGPDPFGGAGFGGRETPVAILEQLGGGTLVAPTRVDLTQGGLQITDDPLDVALKGDGFFAVRRDGAASPGLTRDGRLMVRADGVLVQAASGLPLLDEKNRTITLDPNEPVQVQRDGTIEQRGADVARLRLVAPDDPAHLRKLGDNLMEQRGGLVDATPEVVAGAVESSAVDPVRSLVSLIQTTRAIQANTRLMQYHDQTMERAITGLGRVN